MDHSGTATDRTWSRVNARPWASCACRWATATISSSPSARSTRPQSQWKILVTVPPASVAHYEPAADGSLERIWGVSGTVRVRLLGRVGIEHGDAWLDGAALPGRQGRLVLAYLALHHHAVARDDLADLVWPDALTASWERDLSAVVSKVRAALDSVGLGS